jgi:hypothetical protein
MITDPQIEDFVAKVQALQTDGDVISFERLRKYIRIVTDHGSQRSVWGFVDAANGDIYKAAGWKAPAKHKRGNIANGTAGCSAFGPNYLN